MTTEVFDVGEESVDDNEIWRIRTNKELMALYQESGTVAEIKKARLRWLGHRKDVRRQGLQKTVYEQT
jgi:hypothetical protein